MSEEIQIIDGVHGFGLEENWVRPESPLLQEKLEWFMDQKFGLFVHFGLSTQIGSMESWLLSDEDDAWSQKDLTWDTVEECQRQSMALNRSFNPIRLDAAAWLEVFGEAVYGTRACSPYLKNGWAFTRTPDAVYALCPLPEAAGADSVPCDIPVTSAVCAVTELSSGQPVAFETIPGGIRITAPEAFRGDTPYAVVYRLDI